MFSQGPILLLDIGNTRVKWAVKEDLHVVVPCMLSCRHEELSLLLHYLITFPEPLSAAVIANVSPSRTYDQIVAMLKLLACPVIYEPGVSADFPCCILSSYAWAPILGRDRFAAAVAASFLYRQHTLVVNCGTCMTMDAVYWEGDQRGRLIGGHIAPGIDILFRAIALRLPHLSIASAYFPPEMWGRDTQSCISLGIWDAAIGAVLSQYYRFAQGLSSQKTPIHIVVAGGNACPIVRGLRYFLPEVSVVLRLPLVLEGLLYLYRAYQEAQYTGGRLL